jgi:hypothetical protein
VTGIFLVPSVLPFFFLLISHFSDLPGKNICLRLKTHVIRLSLPRKSRIISAAQGHTLTTPAKSLLPCNISIDSRNLGDYHKFLFTHHCTLAANSSTLTSRGFSKDGQTWTKSMSAPSFEQTYVRWTHEYS